MDASKMSIKELKQVLAESKVPIPTGIEKHELVSMVQTLLLSRPKPTAAYSRVKCFGAKLQECRAIFVFFHGYGADENQFLFFENFIDPGVAVVCPKSPDEGWWPLDVAEWAFALQNGSLLQKIKECPQGLKQARQKALDFIQTLRDQAPSDAKILLGGFSQGGVMATDLALSMGPEIPINLAAFSSFIVDMTHWTERAKLHGGNVRALLTHGKADPLIPFMASEVLSNLLKGAGAEVRFESHGGGHTLGDERILQACKEFFLKAVIN